MLCNGSNFLGQPTAELEGQKQSLKGGRAVVCPGTFGLARPGIAKMRNGLKLWFNFAPFSMEKRHITAGETI